jgi:proteasome regulatory subunit
VEHEVKMEIESLLRRIESKKRENTRALEQIRRENAQPKRMPLFVASVVKVMEGGEAYLRQQGNNQEYITQVKEELHKTLKPGTKVAVNKSLSIVKILEEP